VQWVGCRNHDEYGGKEYDEVRKVCEEIRLLPEVNPNRIGIYGISRGGMIAYMLMKDVSWIKSVAVLGGLADLEKNATMRPEMRSIYEKAFGNTQSGYERRSALCWTEKMHPIPLLILHGGADDKVHVSDALELSSALSLNQHPYTLHVYEGGNHILSTHREEKWKELFTWFQKHI